MDKQIKAEMLAYENKAKKLRPLVREMISDNDLKKFLKQEVKIWKDMSKNKREGFNPMYVVYLLKDNGEIEKQAIMIGGGLGDEHADRLMASYKIGQFIGDKNDNPIVGALLATECWYRKSKEIDVDKKVSDYDDKKEAISIAIETIDARYGMAIMEIGREKDNSIALKKPEYNFTVDNKKNNGMYNPLIHALFDGYKMAQIAKEL